MPSGSCLGGSWPVVPWYCCSEGLQGSGERFSVGKRLPGEDRWATLGLRGVSVGLCLSGSLGKSGSTSLAPRPGGKGCSLNWSWE